MAYPESIDEDVELVEGVSPLAVAEINAIRDSIIAIERELGLNPSGTFGTLADRFQEASVNFSAENVITDVDGPLGGDSVETVLRNQFATASSLRQRVLFTAIDVVDDKSYNILINAPFGGVINGIAIETNSSTCSVGVMIDGYLLDTISASSVRQNLSYSANNEFCAGAEIRLVVSGSIETAMLKVMIRYTPNFQPCLEPDAPVVPQEVDGGLYVGWQATAAVQTMFRQGPFYEDSYAGVGSRSARIGRLTPDLEPWWVVGINPSTEDTLNKIVFINDIIPLHGDAGAIVMGTFTTIRDQPAGSPYSMNFYNADGSLAFNVPKKDKATYGGFFAKVSADGVWQWCRQIWHEGQYISGGDYGAQCIRGTLFPDNSFAITGNAGLPPNNLASPSPSRLQFDDVTSYTNIIPGVYVSRVRLGFTGIYDSDGILLAHQVDGPDSTIEFPAMAYFHIPTNGTDYNTYLYDYSGGLYSWAGGGSPRASTDGVFHTCATIYSGNAGRSLLVDAGNTDVLVPARGEPAYGGYTGYVAARNVAGVDWVGTLIESDVGDDTNFHGFVQVWTFEDGGSIVIGRSNLTAIDDQHPQLERWPTPITPVVLDPNEKSFISAIHYDPSGEVLWAKRIIEFGFITGAQVDFAINDFTYDAANNVMSFTTLSATSAWSVIDGSESLHSMTVVGNGAKIHIISINKDTGAVTHAARLISNADIDVYGISLTVNPLTGKTYTLYNYGASETTTVLPSSVSPYERETDGSRRFSAIAEIELNPSPVDPLTNPYTPTRVKELTHRHGDSYISRTIRPIITTTSYSKASQYYDFYSRRVALAGGVIEDPAATLAFIEFMVATEIWTALSSAFVPWAGFLKDGGGEVNRWFNLHGPDVTASTTLRPIWSAANVDFNGLPSLYFDGVNDFLDNVGDDDALRGNDITMRRDECEFYVVFNAEAIGSNATPSNNEGLISLSLAGLELRSTPSLSMWNNDGTPDGTASPISIGTTHLAHGRHEGGQIISSVDGGAENSVASGNGNTTQITHLQLGKGPASDWFRGDMSIALSFRTNLTPDQRTALFTYLKGLYNIA